MKIYISGKMAGMSEKESRNLFLRASKLIESVNHNPINPWVVNDKLQGASYEDKMKEDLRIIKEEADAIFMLKNWNMSLGAQREYDEAIIKGIPIYYESDPSIFLFDMTFPKVNPVNQ
jgi:hypothetical protein